MKRRIIPAVALCAAVLAGCGAGGVHEPAGDLRPIGFGTSTQIEFFVPQGWDMINQNALSRFDPDEVRAQSGVTYAVLDRSRIPAQLSDAVPEDDRARADFSAQAQTGAAVTAQFTELNPCGAVEEMLGEQRAASDKHVYTTPGRGIGEHRALGVADRVVDGVRYRYVQYYASIPLSSSHCVGLLLQSTLRDPDDVAVAQARAVITRIADNSRTMELSRPGASD